MLFYTITVYRGSYIDPKLHESEKGGYKVFFGREKSKKAHTKNIENKIILIPWLGGFAPSETKSSAIIPDSVFGSQNP